MASAIEERSSRSTSVRLRSRHPAKGRREIALGERGHSMVPPFRLCSEAVSAVMSRMSWSASAEPGVTRPVELPRPAVLDVPLAREQAALLEAAEQGIDRVRVAGDACAFERLEQRRTRSRACAARAGTRGPRSRAAAQDGGRVEDWLARRIREGPELAAFPEDGVGLKLVDHRVPRTRAGPEAVDQDDGDLPWDVRTPQGQGSRLGPIGVDGTRGRRSDVLAWAVVPRIAPGLPAERCLRRRTFGRDAFHR